MLKRKTGARLFLDDLYPRGLVGKGLDMICDSGATLLAAPPEVYGRNARPALLGA